MYPKTFVAQQNAHSTLLMGSRRIAKMTTLTSRLVERLWNAYNSDDNTAWWSSYKCSSSTSVAQIMDSINGRCITPSTRLQFRGITDSSSGRSGFEPTINSFASLPNITRQFDFVYGSQNTPLRHKHTALQMHLIFQ